MKNIILRSIRAALTMIREMAKTSVTTRNNLVTDVFRAIDSRHSLIIRYVKEDGSASRRMIRPLRFILSEAGDISIRAFDTSREGERTFRIDRITEYQ